MGSSGSVPLDETLGDRTAVELQSPAGNSGDYFRSQLIVLAVAAAIFLGCVISPPSLMDDVDAVQAQIARNMLDSGDWVTAHLDGVAYLEKSPLKYWLIAIAFKLFGVRDWVARLPVAFSAVLLCWLVYRMGAWALSVRAGMYAGLALATSVGLFLFTRIQIPDVTITATIALAMWAFLRALEEERHALWASVMAAAIGTGLLLKGLIAAVFPVAAALLYLYFVRPKDAWKRLHLVSGLLVILLIAAPWHILATLRNPPYFAFTLHSGPGQYHGFLWFYFINEQLLRFLNLRYPRDYNTVPRLYFWLLHLVWLFPWSVYFPAIATLSFKPVDRSGQTRLVALCWVGFVLIFFTFSTTQEYYSMPCYPAIALLLGSAMATGGAWIRRGTRVLAVIATSAGLITLALFFLTRNLPAPGDISLALSQHPGAYKLSLGHMQDLTLASFAYLRIPLLVAAIAFCLGALAIWKLAGQRAFLAAALMMVIFFHAARMAMAVFDPFMSSRPLAEAIMKSPEDTLIVDHHYYTFSSIFFYTNRTALLRNGRFFNLEYGAYAPGAPDVFIDNSQFKDVWLKPERSYIVAKQNVVPELESLVGSDHLNLVALSGGKVVMTNHPIVISGSDPAKTASVF